MIVPEGISLGNFIAGRLPSRAVLDELRPYLPDVDRDATPTARAFVVLDRAVTAHAAALDRLDRAERRLVAAGMVVRPFEGDGRHGQREGDGSRPSGREEPSRRYGAHGPSRVHRSGRGSRRRALVVRAARERRLRDRVGEATDYLHSAPAVTSGDIALKLAATIAAGEAGPPDASTFPWSSLCLLADVVGITDATRLCSLLQPELESSRS